MKRNYFVFVFCFVLSTLIFSQDNINFGRIPDGFIISGDIKVVDKNTTTFKDLSESDLELTVSTGNIKKLVSTVVFLQGEIQLKITSGNDILINQEFYCTQGKFFNIDLKNINIENISSIKIKFSRISGSQEVSRVYESEIYGFFVNNPTYTVNLDAANNLCIFDLPSLPDGMIYTADLIFDNLVKGETEGVLELDDGNDGKYEFYILIPELSEKKITFSFLPFIDKKTFTVNFNSKNGNLKQIKIKNTYPINDDDFKNIVSIAPGEKTSNAWNLFDNNQTSDYQGDWAKTEKGIVDINFLESYNHANIMFYWIPGLSNEIRFELCFDDDTHLFLQALDDKEIFFDGYENRIKQDYQVLRYPGWKIVDTGIQEKKIKSIRMYFNAPKTAGGMNEIRVFGDTQGKVNEKFFIPYGYVSPVDDGNLWFYNKTTFNLVHKSKDELINNNGDYNRGKYGFLYRINDVTNLKMLNSNNAYWYIPFTNSVGNGVDIEYNGSNVFNTNNVVIEGKSTYPINIVKINKEFVTMSSSKGRDYFTKSFNFSKDGRYYLTTEVGEDFNLRKKVDQIIIDKTPPEIIVDYPRMTYVSSINSKIRGYIYDLSPERVTINDVECRMTGRWFELDDANVDVPNKQYVIKAYDRAGNTSTKIIYLTVDSEKPILNITYPLSNGSINTKFLTIQGNVQDLSATVIKCRGQELSLNAGGGNFVLSNIPIFDGVDFVKITVTDESENVTEYILRLEVDRINPEIINYESIYYTNKDNVTTSVVVKEMFGAHLYYGNDNNNYTQAVLASFIKNDETHWQGKFTFNTLLPGNSNTIYLMAVDNAGNITEKSFIVIKDTVAPVINISFPDNGYTTSHGNIDIVGTYLEDNMQSIKINSEEIHWGSGSFDKNGFVLSKEGDNEINVIAQDKAGNTSAILLIVKYDATAPNSPDVIAIRNENSVNVSWSVASSADVDHYLIKRVPDFTTGEKIKTINDTTYFDDNSLDFVNNNYYAYHIQSVDNVGNKSGWKIGGTGNKETAIPDKPGIMRLGPMTIRWTGNEITESEEITVNSVEDISVKEKGLYYSPIYDFGPEGTVFNDFIELGFDIPKDTAITEKIKWFYYNVKQQKWIEIPTFYDESTNRLVGMTNHFSAYAVKQVISKSYEDTDLSALKSNREDTNIYVTEATGNVILHEKEMTLKGPGNNDFVLKRSLNTLNYKTNNYYKDENNQEDNPYSIPTYSYIRQSTVQNSGTKPSPDTDDGDLGSWHSDHKWTESDTYRTVINTDSLKREELMDFGMWAWNIPHIINNSIIFEDGSSISVGILELDKTTIINDGKYFEVTPKLNALDNSNLEIKVKTIDGKYYYFIVPRQESATGSGASDFNYKNISSGVSKYNFDKYVFLADSFFGFVDKIVYADENTLYFNCDVINKKIRIRWNDNSWNIITNNNEIEINKNNQNTAGTEIIWNCKNSVTNDIIEYEVIPTQRYSSYHPNHFYGETWIYYTRKFKTVGGNTQYYTIQEYCSSSSGFSGKNDKQISWTDYNISKVKYGNTNTIGRYVISYGQNLGKIDFNLKITYPDGKLKVLDFKQWENTNNNPIFGSLIKDKKRIDSITTYKNLNTSMPIEKTVYDYSRRDGKANISVLSNYVYVDIKDGSGNVIESTMKQFDQFSNLTSENKNNQDITNIEYYGLGDNCQLEWGASKMINLGDDGVFTINFNKKDFSSEFKKYIYHIYVTSTKGFNRHLAYVDDQPKKLIYYLPNYNVCIDQNSVELFRTTTQTYYFSIFDDKIYFYVLNEGSKSAKVKKETRILKDNIYESMPETWTCYDYDGYARQNKVWDMQGNYTSISYEDSIAGTALSNEPKVIIKGRWTNETTPDSGALYESKMTNTYAASDNYIRPTDKVTSICSYTGSTASYTDIKHESYGYDSASKKLNKITNKDSAGNTVKNYINFTYDTAKKDNPLSKISITDASNIELFLRSYGYIEGTGLMSSMQDSYGILTTFGYDYIGRNSEIKFYNGTTATSTSLESSILYNFFDYDSTRTTNASAYYTRSTMDKDNVVLQKDEISYSNSKIDTVSHYTDETKKIDQTFSYDALNRKIGASDYKTNSYTFQYKKQYLTKISKPEIEEGQNISIDFSYLKKTISYNNINNDYIEIVTNDEEKNNKYEYKDKYGRSVFNGVELNGKICGTYTEYNHRNQVASTYEGAYIENKNTLVTTSANVTRYEYDNLGRLIKTIKVDVENNNAAVNVVEENVYDELDFLIEKYRYIEGNDRTSNIYYKYYYDAAGNQKTIEEYKTGVTDPMAVTDMNYDKNTNLIEVIYPAITVREGATDISHRIKKWYVYDKLGRVEQEISNPETSPTIDGGYSKVVFYKYDAMGRVKQTIDMRAAKKTGNAYTMKTDTSTGSVASGLSRPVFTLDETLAGTYAVTTTYNMLGRIVRVTYPGALTESATYDENGNLLTVTNKNNGTSEYKYDIWNNLILEKSEDSVKYYTYYKNSQKNSMLLPEIIKNNISSLKTKSIDDISLDSLNDLSNIGSNVIKYEYDDAGNVSKIIDCYANSTSFTYNNFGLVNSKTLKTGAVLNNTYYKWGMLQSSILTDGTTELQNTEMDYNWMGKNTTYKTAGNLIKTFGYDEKGQLVTSTDSYANTTSKTYNTLGMVTSVTYPDGRTETLKYNKDGQILNDSVVAGTKSYNTDFAYNRISGNVMQTVVAQMTGTIVADRATEDYGYDFWGSVYNYGFNLSSASTGKNLSYTTNYLKDVVNNKEYLSYPENEDKYFVYARDSYSRLTNIGNATAPIASFGYAAGNIYSAAFSNTEAITFNYDELGRVTGETARVGTNTNAIYSLTNEYENYNGNKTENLHRQEIKIGSNDQKQFLYASYDKASRINGYEFTGIDALMETGIGYGEDKRRLFRNDYMLPDSKVGDDNFWLKRDDLKGPNQLGHEDPVEITKDNGLTVEQVNTDGALYRIDRDHSSIEIEFSDEGTDNVQWVSVATTESFKDGRWYGLYYKEQAADQYTPIKKDQYTYKYFNGRAIFTLINPILKAKMIKVVFERDDIDPIPYDIVYDTTTKQFDKDVSLNRVHDYKITGGQDGLYTGIGDAVRVYALVHTVTGLMGFDNADRRTSLTEGGPALSKTASTLSYDNGDADNRIKQQGDKEYLYDNCGRRVVAISLNGTYIYRYDLAGRMTEVYYSYLKYTISNTAFTALKAIDGAIDADLASFKLIERNRYNVSGLRIYKWSETKDSLFYQTPFGYLGKKDLITGEARYLVNYINSEGAATYKFESSQGNYAASEGAVYQSKMNLYNGDRFGTDRAAANNSIPVTVDMQPLFEIGGTTITAATTTSVSVTGIKEYDNTTIVASINVMTALTTTEMLIYHRDQIGSIRAVTKVVNSQSVVVWQGDYRPFGEMLFDASNDNWTPLLTFALHEHDKETGLIYCKQRWLDPMTGQFTQEDPAMDGLNWYAYCGGDALGSVDPDGLAEIYNPYINNNSGVNNWVYFNNENDTVSSYWKQQGYGNWQEAAKYGFYNTETGTYVDVSNRFEQNGNWKSGSDSLVGLTLRPNTYRQYKSSNMNMGDANDDIGPLTGVSDDPGEAARALLELAQGIGMGFGPTTGGLVGETEAIASKAITKMGPMVDDALNVASKKSNVIIDAITGTFSKTAQKVKSKIGSFLEADVKDASKMTTSTKGSYTFKESTLLKNSNKELVDLYKSDDLFQTYTVDKNGCRINTGYMEYKDIPYGALISDSISPGFKGSIYEGTMSVKGGSLNDLWNIETH